MNRLVPLMTMYQQTITNIWLASSGYRSVAKDELIGAEPEQPAYLRRHDSVERPDDVEDSSDRQQLIVCSPKLPAFCPRPVPFRLVRTSPPVDGSAL